MQSFVDQPVIKQKELRVTKLREQNMAKVILQKELNFVKRKCKMQQSTNQGSHKEINV